MTAMNEYISGFTEMNFNVFSQDAQNDEIVDFHELLPELIQNAYDIRVGIRYERKSEKVIAPVTQKNSYMTGYDELVIFFVVPQNIPPAQRLQAKAVEIQELVDEQAKEIKRRELLAQRAQIDEALKAL